MKDKFELAKKAQAEWVQTPLSTRLGAISNFKNLIIGKKETLAKDLTLEVGKPITQSRNELSSLVARLDFFLNNTQSAVADEIVHKHTDNNMVEKITHDPLGVIANISAWNYPYFVGSNVFIPALLTGNAVLYKPSEFALKTGKHITEMLHVAGIPKNLFQLISGDGLVGAELLKLAINGVFFTGSYNTGKKISEAVASKMIKVQLELGGKDPLYICDDADIKIAAESAADGAMYNTGQSCCSVERIYVHEKFYDIFLEYFLKTVQGFVLGDPLDEKTYIGTLTRGKVHQDFLDQQVQDAIKKGAKLLCGGERADFQGKGIYYKPTVLIDVNHTMDIMVEESFGPVIGVQKVKNDEEAIKLMNDTKYGLTAGVYSASRERAAKILAQINSGTVYWNCCDRVSPRLPWSGRGNSGIGTTLSTYGIQTFTQPKAWHI